MEGDFTKPITVGWWAITLAWGALVFLPLDPNIQPQFLAGADELKTKPFPKS